MLVDTPTTLAGDLEDFLEDAFLEEFIDGETLSLASYWLIVNDPCLQ